MQDNDKLEELAMSIIANSGAARSAAFRALEEVKATQWFDKADELLGKAKDSLQVAHEAHRELLKLDSKGEIESMSVLLAHAQDHLMCSELAVELIREIILLYKR